MYSCNHGRGTGIIYPKQHNLTQDELAAEINDSDCTFGQCYVRFIETK